MDEAARYHLTGLALQTSVTGDQVFSSVVAAVPIQPASIETSTGLDTYPYALDNVQDESTTAMQVFQALAMSELGYIYIKSDQRVGGTLTYESRSVRGAANTAIQKFSNTMATVTPERNRANLLNKVQVTAHPRKVDAAATTVLFTLNSQPAVPQGTSITINGPFRDPTQPLARVGGTNLVAPVAVTDYTMNTAADGTGTDITSSYSVSLLTTSGNSVTFLVTATGTASGFITKLQLRGRGIYDYNTTVLSAQDSVNQLAYGQRVINIDMPYQADPAVANEASQYVLNVWSNPLSYITQLQIIGNWSDALMQAVMLRDVSDCIALDETVTGLKSTTRYFINAVDIEIQQGRVFKASFTLAPADQNSYWLLEVAGSSEMGLTTRLGYGLIVGHVDLAHSDSHSDVLHGDTAHDDQHGDVAHVDGSPHSDTAHGDSAHSDSHADVSHADVSHADGAHVDSHSDVSHNDSAHADFSDHSDNGVTVEHSDGDVIIIHQDVSTHSDSHGDSAHIDSHNDTAHSDTAHSDGAHSDSHADAGHSDVTHADHTDAVITPVLHVDTHTDVLHVDTVHGDSHGDAAHGDRN
jgi:hypothetical protein